MYEKQTWVTGEVITKEKLNHMEDGIAEAGSESSEETVEIIDLPTTALSGGVQFYKKNGIGYVHFYNFTKSLSGSVMTLLYNSFSEGMEYDSQLALDIAPITQGTDDQKNIYGFAVDTDNKAYALSVNSAVPGKGLVICMKGNVSGIVTINGWVCYPLYGNTNEESTQ